MNETTFDDKVIAAVEELAAHHFNTEDGSWLLTAANQLRERQELIALIKFQRFAQDGPQVPSWWPERFAWVYIYVWFNSRTLFKRIRQWFQGGKQ